MIFVLDSEVTIRCFNRLPLSAPAEHAQSDEAGGKEQQRRWKRNSAQSGVVQGGDVRRNGMTGVLCCLTQTKVGPLGRTLWSKRAMWCWCGAIGRLLRITGSRCTPASPG